MSGNMEMIGAEALDHARKEFQRFLTEEYNIDPANYDIRFTAWVVDASFEHRLARIEIERELK